MKIAVIRLLRCIGCSLALIQLIKVVGEGGGGKFASVHAQFHVEDHHCGSVFMRGPEHLSQWPGFADTNIERSYQSYSVLHNDSSYQLQDQNSECNNFLPYSMVASCDSSRVEVLFTLAAIQISSRKET